MKKKKLAIYAGVVFLSLGSLYEYKLNKDVEYVSAENIKIEQNSIPDISIVAHRGLSSMEVGNTKEAITKSTDKDYLSGIEFDVRLTNDGEVVLSHGDSVKDENNDVKSISNSTLQELREMKLKMVNKNFLTTVEDLFSLTNMSCIRIQRAHELNKKTGTIVTLDETMDIVDSKKKMYIELKFNDNYDELSSKVVKVLKEHPDTDFIIQCNNYENLKRMQQMYPSYKYQIIIHREDELSYLNEDFDGYSIKYNLVNYDIVKDKINEGKEISVWTVNDLNDFDDITNEIGKYKDNVNYITDYPDCLYYQYKK
jgi:glycerophosphoryl diester phosphodiesterase